MNVACDARIQLLAAKTRFVKASLGIQPLGFARKNPLMSLSGAFLLGFGLTILRGNIKALPMVPLLLDISGALLHLKTLLGRWGNAKKY